MIGQMCWLRVAHGDGEKVLHLRIQPNEPWYPYTAWPEFAVPNYVIPGGSLGWATYQKLIRAGWTLDPSTQAQESLLRLQQKRHEFRRYAAISIIPS